MDRVLLFEFLAFLKAEGFLKRKRITLQTAFAIINAFECKARQNSQASVVNKTCADHSTNNDTD